MQFERVPLQPLPAAGSRHITRSSYHFKITTRSILLCSIIILGLGYTASHLSGNDHTAPIPTNASTAPAFNNVIVILMENHGLNDIVGSATYMTTLANTYGLATQYTAVSHPSEPNYLALLGGDTFGITGDGVCCWSINSSNIVDRIESAGLTWQAWAEDASGSGTCSFRPPRSADHFAFLEFNDINTASRCANFHSTQSSSDSEFVNALNTNASNFMWLTPNDCNNMHGCSVSKGDTYLAGLVPKILTSNLFTTQKAALFIVFDEGNNNYPNDYVYSVWAGSAVKKAFSSSSQYSHYSFLRTIETNWNLPSLTSNDASAPAMTEFFNTSISNQLQASFTETSTTPKVGNAVNFTASASGGILPFTYSWTYGDNKTGSGISSTHIYTSEGTETVTLSVQDSSSPSQTATSSRIVTVSNGSPSPGGDFGTCTPLPLGWSCGNTNGLTGSSATIINGTLQTRESNPNVGNDTRYYYSTSQKGRFPWSPCQGPVSGILPINVTAVSTAFTPLVFTPSGSYRYHIYIALYYWLPNGPVVSGSTSYRCLDTQVRVQNINGAFSPVGTTATYNPGDSFGWDNVTIGQISMGQTYTLSANVENQCRQDLIAWHLNPSTSCQLAGIEIGTEGFKFQELDVNWPSVTLLTTAQAKLTAAIMATTTNLHAGRNMSFSSSTSGGTGPYTYSWALGDGSTAIGPTVSHTYLKSGNYTATLVVTDSSATIQTYTATRVMNVGTSCVPAQYVRADVNQDGRVDMTDFILAAKAFQSTPSSVNWNPSADINQDGIVSIIDVGIIAVLVGQSIC